MMRISEAQGEHGTETIYWIAWQVGASSEAGKVPFVAAIQEGVTHEFTANAFSPTFGAPPCFADMQTMSGVDPANLRYRSLTASGVEVWVVDEQSADKEIRHGAETVGWVAFGCD